MKKIFALIFLLIFSLAGLTFAADVDFDLDSDNKLDTIFFDFSWDIIGAVECDGAGACTQAEYEDLSNYNALDPDYLTGDTTDDNLIDVAVINTAALKVTLSTDDLWTLSGRAEGSQHLGTFTGSTIDDNLTIKAAFQDLETYVESLGGGHDPATLSTDLNSNLLGISTQQLTLDSQSANLVFAGPASGGAAAPTFRSLVAADIPDLSATYELQLVNEAGLYAVLSDVSQFYEPGDVVQTSSGLLSAIPASCTIGELYFATDADGGEGSLYNCRATNTWKEVDDDGGGGSDVLAKVSSNETDADYLVNQIGSSTGEIDVTETGTGDETLNLAIDVTPVATSATLQVTDDALQIKFNANDFDASTNGLYIDYTNGQAANTTTKGFLTSADWNTFNAKESETHASEHAVGAADPVFPADPNFNGIFTWDDTAGVTEWGTSADLTYDGANWIVVDDSHNHIYSNIDPMTEAQLYTILSDVSQFYEAWDSPDFTRIYFADQSFAPAAAGEFGYNNNIAGLIDGGFVWYDDDEIQLIVSVPMDNFGTGPTDDYVVAYDAINDEHYYMAASAAGGPTKFNLIADADADGEIQLLGFEQTITTTIDEAGGVALTVKHTDIDGIINDTYLMELIYANDGDAQAHFMRGLDNTNDELWKIAYDGTATFKAVQTSGSDTPGFIAKDLQNPGADLEIGKIYWNWLSGIDGQEDGGVYLQVMIGGSERTILDYDADTEAMTLGASDTGEDLVFDFDTGTSNEVAVSSNSGVTVVDFGTINLEADQFESDIATGTPPFVVASTTKVINLNVDQVDGESASEIVTAARVGAVSANLDDTDASVEWEDAGALDSSGNLVANAVDAITEIAAGLKSGADTTLVTGTKGTNGQLGTWNTDGDLVGTSTLSGITIGGFTANRAVESDGSGNLESSAVTDTELAMLSGKTLGGADTKIMTGTPGTNTYVAVWNTDGDLVNGSGPQYLKSADVETQCIYIEDPDASDDLKSIWYTPVAVTLTQIWAESDQTVTFMLQVDDGTPADVDSVDLAPAAGTAIDTALNGDATMAAGDRLDIDLVSVASTPTWVSICWSYVRD